MQSKKFLIPLLLFVVFLFEFTQNATAVPADPHPFRYRQPDGTVVTIILNGDEKVHWAETTDGFTLLNNGKSGWEYAKMNRNGDIECSKILAHEKEKRLAKENKLLKGISKNLTFSKSQVQILRQVWNIKQSNNTLKSVSSLNDSKKNMVFSPLGSKNLVMILIGYQDKAFTKTKEDFDGLMNQSGYNLYGAEGSVKDFFLEASYNNFNITTTVAGPYTAAHKMSYYGANDVNGDDLNPKALITEAVTLANADVNYADFDNDGDGSVDGVYVVYAGKGEATSGIDSTIWPHAGSIPTLTFDGKTISKYSCSNEFNPDGSLTTIGVICHEFGHVCGAKDYYDTDYATSGQYDGTGYWDVMATGVYDGALSGSKPAHFNPYEKIRAGWASATLLTAASSVTIPDVTGSPIIYRYNTTSSNEYFLLENRQQTGFNTYVPGHGLMIYHVDGDYVSSHFSSNDINVDSHQGVYPMAANATTDNGVMTHSESTINTDGCPWPGTTGYDEFSDQYPPYSQSWAGVNTDGSLKNIKENSGIITLCYKSCPAVNPILSFSAVGVSASQINLSWTKNVANNDVIIAENTTNTFGSLTDGTTYNVNDAILGGGTIIYKGSASNFNHNGLSASTNYYYQIWSVNSTPDYSESLAINAQTLCSSLTSFPYHEGFEGGTLPGCWTQEYVSGTSNWAFQNGGYLGGSYPSVAHSGTVNACLFVASWTPNVTKLISQPIDLTGSTTPVLKFWHTQQNWSTGQDILRVYYRASATGAWSELATYSASISSWALESINLPSPSSTYYIAFEATTNYGHGVCIDDVEIRTSDCIAGTWTGDVSSDWFNLENWCGGSVPTTTTDVIIPSGTPNNPSIDASGAYCKNITIESGAALSMNSSAQYTLNVSGNWINNGSFSSGIGKVRFDGTNSLQTISGSSKTDFYILRVSKGTQDRILDATSLIGLTSLTDPLELSSGTFKLSSNSTITPFTTNGYSLPSSSGFWNNGATITLPSTIYVYGLLKNTNGTLNAYYLAYIGTLSDFDIEGGTLNISSRLYPSTPASDVTTYNQSGGTVNVTTVSSSSATIAPFDLRSGSSFTMSGGTIAFQKASSFASGEYYNQAGTCSVTGGTIQIGNGSTSSSPNIRINTSVPIYNLTVNGTGTPTAKLLSNVTVLNYVINNSTLDASSLNIALGGNWTNNGTFTSGTGTVTFSGSNNQNIDGTIATAFNNLTLNNSNGLTLAGSVNATVNSVLTLNSGVLSTGNNKVIIPASGSISRNSGHIFGNLQKNFAVGSNVTRTFEVGDASSLNYAPVSLSMASVTTAGNIIAKTVSGDHPNIGSSLLYPTKSVNRYWTLTNSGVAFTTYNGEFTFLNGDIDGTANTSNLVCGAYSSSSWAYPSIGTKTSNTTQVTGLSSFGDFQLSEGCTSPVTPTFDPVAAICSGGTLSALPTTSKNSITGVWSPALDNTKTTTYTFTPTAGQCANTTTMDIVVNPKVTPTFDPVDAICSGSTLSALPTTSKNSITGVWSPALDNTTTTTYTFTPTAGQCANTTTMDIVVNPKVTPTFDPVAAICSGSTLSALPTTSKNSITGVWSPALDNTKTTTYTFTPTAGQCANTTTLDIVVNPKVTPTFDPVAAICSGGTLSALPTTSKNSITGVWSPALDNTKTTTYTFTPTAGQCANTTTLDIVVNPKVTPTFDPVAAICSGGTLSALPTTSKNSITGVWSPALDNTKTTTYTFTPTAGQCANTTILDIVVNPKVTPTFDPVAAICSGGTLSALPTTSKNSITGVWSPALDNTKTTTYTFTPTAGQCANTTTLDIVVNPKVTPTFDPVAAICSGSTLSALPTTSKNSITGVWSPALDNTKTTTYTFTPTAGQCANTTTLDIVVNPKVTPTFDPVAAICSGGTLSALPTTSKNSITGVWSPALDNTTTTTYTFTPTAGQCANTTTMDIVVNPKVTPTFDPVAAICSGSTLSALPTTSKNSITGVWSPALDNTKTTTYTFTPTAGQCANTTTMDIVVNPKVTPTFDPVAAICSGGTLSALPTTSKNSITGVWSPALDNTTTTTYTFTPTAGQCANTTTMDIVVNPKVTPTFDPVAAICSGSTLSALPTTSKNSITGVWSPALDNTKTTTYTFTPTAGQCANTTTMDIVVNPKVTPTFDPVDAICSGSTLSALPTTSKNSITGVWSPALDNTTTTTYTFTPTAGQCANTTTMDIVVNPKVTPTFDPVAAICSGSTLSALPTTSKNSITGVWSPALDNTKTTTYTFTPTAGQCANTTTLDIVVNPKVTPTFDPVAAICSGGTLSALPTTSKNSITGVWSPALDNTKTTTYTFTPTAGQCANTTTLDIVVNPKVTPTFDPVAAICSGGTLSALPTTSKNSITGVWSPALDNTKTTTYTFTPTAGQCANTTTLDIVVNPKVTPTFDPVAAICSGGTLSALPTTSKNSITGVWSPALDNTKTTTYTFTPTAGQCANTTTLDIVVNPKVTPTFDPVAAICSGSTLSALPTTSKNSITGVWSPALDNTKTTTYTFTPTAGQCANTTTLDIVVNPKVTPTFDPVAAICSGGTLSALPTTSKNSITGVWSPALDNTTTTTYTFTPTAGQCANTTTMDIVVNPKVTPTFDPVAAICSGSTLSALPTTSKNSITGVWSPALDNTKTTTYTFTPTAGQCANTTTMDIVVNPKVTPTFDPVAAICSGGTLSALPTTSKNSITGVWSPALDNTKTTTYTFTPTAGQCANTTTLDIVVNPKVTPTFDPVAAICSGGTLSALPTTSKNSITGVWSPALDNTKTTTYTFTPTAGQCANTTILDIVVNPKVTPTFDPVAAICSGGTLSALPTTSKNSITGVWSPALDNTKTTTYTFTPTAGQCANTTTLDIVVNPKVTPTFDPVAAICSGSTLSALPTTSKNSITGVWSPALDNTKTTTYTFTPTAGQCANTTTLDIVVNPKVTPTFDPVAAICSGGTLSALPTTSKNSITGVWSPALDNTTTTTYTFTPTAGQCANTTTMDIVVNPKVTPTFDPVAAICSGSTLSALPTTSKNSITGVWSPALDNTKTTTYTFTPTAGQCANTTTMDIVVNPKVTPTFDPVAAICSGGTLSALPTTSKNSITGVWSPALDNTTTTTYTFTPTAGQCANTTTMDIVVNPKVTPTFDPVAAICSGSTLSALPTTSKNSITGVWSPALDNTKTTTYTFTPTAGQCANTTTMDIVVNPKVTPTFDPVAAICSGSTLSALPTTSKNSITGVWSPALDNTKTTTYTFTPTAGQCANTTTMDIVVNPKVTPTFDPVAAICSGSTLSALPTTSKNSITGVWSPALDNTKTTTYTFTPTAGQCANTTTMDIVVNPKVTPTFDPVDAICSGSTLSALPTTSKNSITGVWSPALDNTTTTTYTFTPTAGQCANTTTMDIVVNPKVTPTFDPVAAICSGSTLSALPTTSKNSITGVWSPALDNTKTTTYTFTPTAGQCANTTTLDIVVNPKVTPTFDPVAAICSGGTLSALPTTSKNSITGVWSPALDNTKTTTYTFTPTAGQCANTTTLDIVVNPKVTPTFDPVAAICSGGTLSALPTTSKNSITGVWSPALDNTKTTTYTFTPTAGQCANTTTLDIVVNPKVTPTFDPVAAICSGGTLSALPTTSKNSITGVWSPALDNTKTTTYTFTPTAGQCANTTTLDIVVNPKVTPTFDPVAAICSGSTLSALPTTSKNSITGVWSPALDNTKTTTYTFTPTAGQCANTTTLDIVVNPKVTPTFDPVAAICSGGTLSALPTTSKNSITGVWSPALDNTTTTTYTFTPTAGQCANTTTMDIVVNPKVTPTFDPVAAICSGSTLSALPTTSKNSITGVWSPALDNTKTTTYTFTPTAGQCANTTTMDIVVNPKVTPTFDPVAAICSGGTLSALPTTSKNSITGVWSPALDNTKTTTYTFTPTAGQCANTTTLDIVVNPKVTPTFDPVAAICSGGTLSALPTTSKNSITGVWSPALDNTKTTTYTFTPTAGQCANTTILDIVVNPKVTPTFDPVAAICSGGTLSALPTTSKNSITGVWSPALDNTKTTTYTFTPTAGQCANTTTLDIVVNPKVTPTFDPVAAICSGSTLSALPTTSKNSITGVWSPALDNTKTTTYTFTPTAGQCANTTTLDIVVNPKVTPTFDPVAAICSGGTLSALPTTSKNSITGVWSPALDNTTTTTYTFTPTAGQCANTTTMDIVVNPKVTPTFDPVAAICSGSTLSALPTTSKNSITGVWSPALDNTKTTTYTFTPTAGQCANTTTMDIVVNPKVTPTFDPVAAICSGGTLSALPTTSKNSITGVWSPALDNTTTTTYTFTPTAGQCANTTTMDIVVNPKVTPTFDPVAAICSGSTLSALPTTSKNSITGVWSPALDNTKTTTYTFTPTAGQCANTTTMDIVVNPKVTPTFDPVAAICSGSTLSALPTTSKNSITGVWSPALDNTKTTTYTFTPTAGQCANTTTMDIVVNPKVTPTFDPVAAICSGSTLSALPTTSKNSITGVWSPALDNTATTTYTFTPTAGQCANTTTMDIVVNEKPTTPIITINGNNLKTNSPVGNQWYDLNGLITGATNQEYNVKTDGYYYVITTLSGCSSDKSDSINIVISGIEITDNYPTINIYPNPVSNELNIEVEGSNEKVSFEIINDIGTIVSKGTFIGKTKENTGILKSGFYIIKLKIKNNYYLKKIVKNRTR